MEFSFISSLLEDSHHVKSNTIDSQEVENAVVE
jgi:hypothetical protein